MSNSYRMEAWDDTVIWQAQIRQVGFQHDLHSLCCWFFFFFLVINKIKLYLIEHKKPEWQRNLKGEVITKWLLLWVHRFFWNDRNVLELDWLHNYLTSLFFCYCDFGLLAMSLSMWDLSFWTKDWTCTPCIGSMMS